MQPKPKPTPVNLLTWAGCGALIGLVFKAFNADYVNPADSIYARNYALYGEFLGSVVGGAFFGVLAGFVRNIFVR